MVPEMWQIGDCVERGSVTAQVYGCGELIVICWQVEHGWLSLTAPQKFLEERGWEKVSCDILAAKL